MNSAVTPTGPLPHGEDPEFHSFSEEFEQRFFADAEQVRIQVTLMRETWDELQQVIEENDWKLNEGLIVLLTTGMAFLKAERALAVTQGTGEFSAEEIQKLLDRQMVIEARYASIKNFAFDLMRDHRTLELRYAPLEREYLAFRNMVWPLRRENDALRAELARLKQELEATRSALSDATPPEERKHWKRWLGALRRGFRHGGQ